MVNDRQLNSKKLNVGKNDSWWYNITPSKIAIGDEIQFNLWDENNNTIEFSFLLKVDNTWYERIMHASTHFNNGREICKVHFKRPHYSNQCYVYFGRKEDGMYPIK